MKVESHGISLKGTVHPKEDEILVNDEKSLYAVADGVTLSSRGSGGVASQLAIYYLSKFFNYNIKETLEKLNNEICELRVTDKSIGETTLTSAHIKGHRIDVASVGDSSAFIASPSAIRKITQDDSFNFGLTQVIGARGLVVHSYNENLQRNDCVILATDGITSVLGPHEMLGIAANLRGSKQICEAILDKVNSTPKDYDDDKSIIVIEIS